MSRELDAQVAERVMGLKACEVRVFGGHQYVLCYYDEDANKPLDGGWSAHQLRTNFGPPPYTTCPTADYSVLVRVRETWTEKDLLQFDEVLYDLWDERSTAMRYFQYQAGDWSRAALAVLEGRGK